MGNSYHLSLPRTSAVTFLANRLAPKPLNPFLYMILFDILQVLGQ